MILTGKETNSVVIFRALHYNYNKPSRQNLVLHTRVRSITDRDGNSDRKSNIT